MTRTWRSSSAITSSDNVWGGRAQAESPEWTPASSTCSITPQMTTSPVASRTASTSTSTASSRNRSTSTGRSAVTPPSRPSEPPTPDMASTASTRRSSS